MFPERERQSQASDCLSGFQVRAASIASSMRSTATTSKPSIGRFGALLADRAYDAQERVVDVLNAGGVEVVIPSKINRTYRRTHDKNLYAARHLVENFFAKLKAFRAISTRYDKRAFIFLGAIYLASAVILLK